MTNETTLKEISNACTEYLSTQDLEFHTREIIKHAFYAGIVWQKEQNKKIPINYTLSEVNCISLSNKIIDSLRTTQNLSKQIADEVAKEVTESFKTKEPHGLFTKENQEQIQVTENTLEPPNADDVEQAREAARQGQGTTIDKIIDEEKTKNKVILVCRKCGEKNKCELICYFANNEYDGFNPKPMISRCVCTPFNVAEWKKQ